ncbi:MAG: HAD-IA family hydrolase [Thiomargarita sp.]|nr:HAD-IA family hydrolase [Thiomargarita sp.]
MQTLKEQISIAERLWIPIDTQAIFWDMDGVLIDSLSLDLVVCNQLLKQHFGNNITVSKPFIRSIFAYDPKKFWELILAFVEKTYNLSEVMKPLDKILEAFHQARHDCVFELNPGISEILKAARAKSLKMAVVSNNPTVDVEDILKRCGIVNYFDSIVGNDIQKLAKKPAPDTYFLAARLLDVNPEKSVVIEDSLIGIEAGYNAKCYTIGVATGGTEFEVLEQLGWAQQIYSSFEVNPFSLQFGDVRKKKIITPNEFVSHAIEHVAWRLGVEIDLNWHNNDWLTLGETFGRKIRAFQIQEKFGVALGMIDDGSAEVSIEMTDVPSVDMSVIENIDLDWFLSLRCEQLPSGKPLVEIAQGLAQGLGARISIKVCSVEDPHHTWEGVFRAIGIALNKIFTPKHPAALPFDDEVEENVSQGEISVLAKSLHYSKVCRGTAESYVKVSVDFSKQRPNHFVFNVAPTIDVSELHCLLEILANEAGFTMQVEFNATVLSSSHVVLEDMALVLGRALLEILTLRMIQWGINGAGSSIDTYSDIETQPIRVGISVEGRKFWKFVPFKVSLDKVRQDFIIGHNIYDHLRSEDLDDFLDGLSGGLTCSIIIHIEELVDPNKGWQLLFKNLGKALKEVFAFNCYRKGVPPGVKATLS